MGNVTYFFFFFGSDTDTLCSIGCESAYVVQDTVTAMWFRGKDISIALGFATSAGGLGEIVSFGLLAQMVEWFDSYVIVFWFGTYRIFIEIS